MELLGGVWDSKVGIWAFTRLGVALRNSCNHPAGTPITVNLLVTKNVFHNYVLERLIPAVITKWPQEYDGLGNMHAQQVKVQYNTCCVHVTPQKFAGIVAVKLSLSLISAKDLSKLLQ